MAQLTLTIPDTAVPRVGAAFRSAYPALEGTDAQIVKQMLVAHLKQITRDQERLVIEAEGLEQAREAAAANDAQVEAIPIS